MRRSAAIGQAAKLSARQLGPATLNWMGRGENRQDQMLDEVVRFGLEGVIESSVEADRRDQIGYLNELQAGIRGLEERSQKMRNGVSRRILVEKPRLLQAALASDDRSVAAARGLFLLEAGRNLMFERGSLYLHPDTRTWFSAFGIFDNGSEWIAAEHFSKPQHIVDPRGQETLCGITLQGSGLDRGQPRGNFQAAGRGCTDCARALHELPATHQAVADAQEDYFFPVAQDSTIDTIVESVSGRFDELLSKDLEDEQGAGTFTISAERYGFASRQAGELEAARYCLEYWSAKRLLGYSDFPFESLFRTAPDDHEGDTVKAKRLLGCLGDAIEEAYGPARDLTWPSDDELLQLVSTLPYLGRAEMVKALVDTYWPKAIPGYWQRFKAEVQQHKEFGVIRYGRRLVSPEDEES